MPKECRPKNTDNFI